MLANGPCTVSSSCCRVWCSRSIFPVVVGDLGLVRQWVMPFSPADPFEQHLRRAGPAEPPGELLAVVAEHFGGNPVLLHCRHERQAHRAGSGPQYDGGDDAEPGMVINPGDDLGFAAIGQEQAGRDVHLPQFHRRRTLAGAVLVPAPAPRFSVVADGPLVTARARGYLAESNDEDRKAGVWYQR
jgi:hypothetical protein